MSGSKVIPVTAGGDTTVDVPLLTDEKAALLYESGVATVTFYKGGTILLLLLYTVPSLLVYIYPIISSCAPHWRLAYLLLSPGHQVQSLSLSLVSLLSCNFFSSSSYTPDFATASSALRSQLGAVCVANPWLAGRLVKTKESGVTLRHPAAVIPDSVHVDVLFTSAAAADRTAKGIPDLVPNKPYADMMTELYASKTLVVDTGSSLVDQDKPVTLLTLAGNSACSFEYTHTHTRQSLISCLISHFIIIIKIIYCRTLTESAPGEFAMVFSISHGE